VIENTDIIQVDYFNNRRVIGKTAAAYEELETTTRQYYDKLVELGVIVPDKAPEVMMAEMQGTMLEMAKVIAGLSEEIKELKANGYERDHIGGGPDVSGDKPKRSSAKSANGAERNA
jgi:hypothetical protein